MAVTESPPEVVTHRCVGRPPHPAPPGWRRSSGSGDHKVIGRAYIVIVAAVRARRPPSPASSSAVEHIDTSRFNVLTADTDVPGLHVPQRLGRRSCSCCRCCSASPSWSCPCRSAHRRIAFPRAAAASFWAWLIAGGAGRDQLPDQRRARRAAGPGASTCGSWPWPRVLAALLLGAGCIVTTVLGLRAPGMSPRPGADVRLVDAGGRGDVAPDPAGAGRRRSCSCTSTTSTAGSPSAPNRGHVRPDRLGVPPPAGLRVRRPGARLRRRCAGGHRPDTAGVPGVAMGAIAAFGALGFGAFVQLSVYSDAVKQPAYIGMSLLAVVAGPAAARRSGPISFRRGRFSFSCAAPVRRRRRADAAGRRARRCGRRDPSAQGGQHRVGSRSHPLRRRSPPLIAVLGGLVLVGDQGDRSAGRPGRRWDSPRSACCSARCCWRSPTWSRRSCTHTRSRRRRACPSPRHR